MCHLGSSRKPRTRELEQCFYLDPPPTDITGSGRIEKGGTQHDSLDQSIRQVRTNLTVLSLDGDVTSF